MSKYVPRLEGIMEKCDLLNKYFSFISKSRFRIDKNNNIADLNVSIKEISDIIQILHANKIHISEFL
jgi:transposase-like protein